MNTFFHNYITQVRAALSGSLLLAGGLLLTGGLLLSAFSPEVARSQDLLVRNATVITVSGDDLAETDVLIRGGIIRQIGKNLAAPAGVEVIDATGLYMAPGIIDAHSHLAISRGINEATHPVTAEVSMYDVVNPHDVGMYRALAGGVTSIHIMHGSANVIGGQGATLKLHYGEPAERLHFPGAPRTIKFALGENPTRVHGQGSGIHPRTRMGVEQVIRSHFDEALEYRAKRREYLSARTRHEQNPRRNAAPEPVARNLRMDTLVDILEGNILVHCHSYRADEILMLMRVFNDYGIRNYTMQHANEAYMVAPELRKNNVFTSIFADWWAYKFEVYYSTAYSAAILHENGVINSINSDSPELIRHLNHEAGKAMKYGGVDANTALRMITLHPAMQLGVADKVGSLEVGKHADFALWSHHPLSIYSVNQMTFVDGVKRFDINADPADMRLQVSASDEYDGGFWEAERHHDACMQDVFFLFGEMTAHTHNH
jgi:imidazolonepropionase-like amidohydrolase